MPDEYQGAVHKLMEYLNDTAVFAKAELPDIASQILIYGADKAWLLLAFFLLVAFACLSGLAIMAYRKTEHSVLPTFFGIGLLFAAPLVLHEISTLMKIHEAPKLYILDQLAQRVNGQFNP